MATPPVAGFEDNSSLTVTLQEIRQQQGQTEPPTTQQPPPASQPDAQPKDRLSSLLPVLLPVVLGVAVLAAAGLFGMKVVRMRRLGRVAVAGGQPAAAGPANGGGTGNLLMGGWETVPLYVAGLHRHSSQQPVAEQITYVEVSCLVCQSCFAHARALCDVLLGTAAASVQCTCATSTSD